MSESNTIIGINFGTAYTSIAYLNKVRLKEHWTSFFACGREH